MLCSESLSSFGDGSIYAVKDDAVAQITRLLNDSDYLKDMKQKARENAVDNFTWSKVAQDYYDNFKR